MTAAARDEPAVPIDPAARPRLAGGARLQTDRLTGQPMLLFPEGMLRLNPTGAAILALCDGRRSMADVVAALAGQFDAAPETLSADVTGYARRLCQRGLLELDADVSPGRGGVGGEGGAGGGVGGP